MAALAARGLGRIHCEGGPALLSGMVSAGLLDELLLTLVPTLHGGGAGEHIIDIPGGLDPAAAPGPRRGPRGGRHRALARPEARVLTPPIEPMLAKPLGHEVPTGADGLSFEPKWDGFRCLVFRSESGVVLQGRGRSKDADEVVDLAYAFPELVAATTEQLPVGTVIDGEIVVLRDGRLDFGLLSSRLRPRSEAGGTNIDRLAQAVPAALLAFDVLWSGGDWRDRPFEDRRRELARLGGSWSDPLFLTPWTTDPSVAAGWFHGFESAGVDGLIVKPLADPYQPGKRAQGKVKHERTADVVVAGWRAHARPGADGQPVVGSLLLGLHDDEGRLHYVGAASAFTAAVRADLVGLLAPFAVTDDARAPVARSLRGERPRRGQPLEEGAGLPGAATGARRRGDLRPDGGAALPPCRRLRPLAPGPRPGLVRVRPARGSAAARASTTSSTPDPRSRGDRAPARLHSRRLPRHLREVRRVGQLGQPGLHVGIPGRQRGAEVGGRRAHPRPRIDRRERRRARAPCGA